MSLVGVSVLCLITFAGLALAQEQPPEPEPESEAEATPPTGDEKKPETPPSAEPAEQAEDASQIEPPVAVEATPSVGTTDKQGGATRISAREARARRARVTDRGRTGTSRKYDPERRKAPRPKRKPAFEMDPNAKWACDETVASLDPVWRGDKKLTFNFDIRNEGTADLKIKAKGG
jgi:hypothetical protein